MPHRLKGIPRAFTKSSGEVAGPRIANQARSAAAVVFQRGNARSRRPLPRTRILADWGATSSSRKPVSSETRRPAHTARCSMARSRTPSRVDGSGESSRACISSWMRYGTKRLSVFLKGIARTRRTCSTAAGSRCCRKRKNERIAAKRMFHVSAELPRMVFQIYQEGANQSCVQLLQQQGRWRHFEFLRGESEQRLKAVGIRIARVLASATVAGKMLAEEGFHVRCEGSQGCPPCRKLSVTIAISRRSSGVVSRYQLVALMLTWPR